jgi:hypothetical protein
MPNGACGGDRVHFMLVYELPNQYMYQYPNNNN